MASTPGADRPRSFFDRLTEPFADRAREKFEQVEDHVREAIQARDRRGRAQRPVAGDRGPPVGDRVRRRRAGHASSVSRCSSRPRVLGLSHAVEPWLAALIIGVALLLIGAGVAAWAKRRHLPPGPPVSVVRIHEPVHPAEEQVHPWAD